MAFSCKNPHFLLKIITLILLVLTIFVTLQPSGTWAQSVIVEGLTSTSTIVILVLIISYAIFESPKITEICLILAVVAMLVICCSLWCAGEQNVSVPSNTNAHYVVFSKENDRRIAYLGLTLSVVVFEVIDVVLHATNK